MQDIAGEAGRDELISDVLQWTFCEDTGCRPEDLPEGMNDRED